MDTEILSLLSESRNETSQTRVILSLMEDEVEFLLPEAFGQRLTESYRQLSISNMTDDKKLSMLEQEVKSEEQHVERLREEQKLKKQNLKELTFKLGEFEERLKKTSEEIKLRQEQLDWFKKERERLLIKKEENDSKDNKTINLTSMAKLLAEFSCIRWNYDCEPHEISGFISEHSNLQTFRLDSQQRSQFSITNQLWDMMQIQ